MKNKLITGDILHCKGKGIFSSIIRVCTKSDITHSAVFLEIWGQPYIIDAQPDGVNPRPFYEWCEKYKYEYIVHRPSFLEHKEFSIKAFRKVGLTSYPFIHLIIKYIIHFLTGKWISDNKKKMFCSEYVAWLYGIENPERLTPVDLYNHCNGSKEFKRIDP